MKLALALILVTGTAYADSSSLALTLPNPPMNYQSDTFSSGNLRCSNAVGGATSLEFGVMGNLNNIILKKALDRNLVEEDFLFR